MFATHLEPVIVVGSALAFIILGFIGPKNRAAGPAPDLKPMGAFRIAAGLAMSFVGGAATITMSGIGYSNGWWGLIDPLAVLLGGMLAVAVLSRTRIPDSTQGIARFFSGGDSKLSIVYAVASVFVYLLLAAAQIVALSKLFEPYLPFASVFSGVCYLLVVTYIRLGGLASVTRTDLAQLLIILALFVAPATVGLLRSGGFSTSDASILHAHGHTNGLAALSLITFRPAIARCLGEGSARAIARPRPDWNNRRRVALCCDCFPRHRSWGWRRSIRHDVGGS
ncbi:MAG: hypothetical protein IPM24_03360 [Bryobacterales bacterium]|nr:hypothetical protein [Bryobacterales bacterium]